MELCRVHWNCVHIYGLFKLTFSSILRGERYSNRDWFLFTCGFVAHSVVWERFGSFCSRGEHWFTRTNFVLFDTASRLLLCQNSFTCTTFEIRVGRLYYLFAIRENSGFSKVCDNSHLVCVWSLFVLWPIVQWSKMSVRSVPVADKLEQQNVQETLSEGRLGTQLRRSSRVKVPSNIDFESRTAERANTLKYSCAGYVATLTRLRGNIQGIIENCGTLEDLQLKRDSYEEAWRRFVNTHEEYIECLDVLSRYEDVERADANYKEQMSKKATFDNEIETWKFQVTSSIKKRENDLKSYPRKSRKSTKSGSTGSSSASLAVAKKKEKLALAQLKTKQVLQEQQLQRKLSELQFEKDMLEAKMEEERAKASLNVYEEFENQCRKSQYRERLAEFIPEETLHPHGNQAQNVAQSQLIEPHEQLVQELAPLEQVPALRDNERIMNSAAKTFQSASVTVPNPVFSETEHTVYVDEAGTGKHTEQPNNAKDTEALRRSPVNPSVLHLSQQVQTPLITHFSTKEYSQWPTQVPWSQTPVAVPAECYMREPASVTLDSRAEMVQALRQVVSTQRIEYCQAWGMNTSVI